jgi:hypothetical protein
MMAENIEFRAGVICSVFQNMLIINSSWRRSTFSVAHVAG